MCRIHPKEIFARHFASNHGAQAVQRADRGVPRRANGGEKTTEAGLLQKRRRGTAAAAAQAPGAEAHIAEDRENDDNLEPNQHAAARHQNKVQADLDGKLGDVGAAAELKRRLARAAGENARETRMSAVTGAADLGPHLTKAVCWVDIGAVSDDLSRALHARSCRSTENRADAAVYIVKDPNKPGRRVLRYAWLKGALVVTGRAFTHPADVRRPVVRYLPATSPARTVYITEAFAEKHAEIATILRDTCPAWTFEVDLEAPAPPPAPPVHRCHQHVNCRAWHLPTATPLPPSLQPPGLAGILGEVQRREKTEQEVSNGDPQKAERSGGGAAQRRGGHRIAFLKSTVAASGGDEARLRPRFTPHVPPAAGPEALPHRHVHGETVRRLSAHCALANAAALARLACSCCAAR